MPSRPLIGRTRSNPNSSRRPALGAAAPRGGGGGAGRGAGRPTLRRGTSAFFENANEAGKRFVQKHSAMRRQSSSAKQDHNFLNVLGTDNLVSTANVLEHIELVKTTETITKVEFEDLMLRKHDSDEILEVIQNLAIDTFERQWKSIQFTDCVYAFGRDTDETGLSRALNQLYEYEEKRQQLHEHMEAPPRRNATARLSSLSLSALQAFKDFSSRQDGSSELIGSSFMDFSERNDQKLPVVFQVKLEIHAGTPLDGLLSMMRIFEGTSLENIDFGGALFGFQYRTIPNQLVKIFQKVSREGEEDEYILQEMISLELVHASPSSTEEYDTANVVKRCVRGLSQLKAALKNPDLLDEDGNLRQKSNHLRRKKSLKSMGASNHSRKSTAEGSSHSREGKLSRKKSERSFSTGDESFSGASVGSVDSRRRRSDKKKAPLKIKRCHSAPDPEKHRSDHHLPAVDVEHLLDDEDLKSWGALTSDSEAEEGKGTGDDAKFKQMKRASRKKSEVLVSKGGLARPKPISRARSAPIKEIRSRARARSPSPTPIPLCIGSRNAAGDSSAHGKDTAMDDDTKATTNSAGSKSEKTSNGMSDAQQRMGNSSMSNVSKIPRLRKMNRRSISSPNLKRDSDAKQRMSIATAAATDGSEEFLGPKDGESSPTVDDNNKDVEEDGAHKGEEDVYPSRKKSDASVSSTLHSAGRRRKNKKIRRRSKSLPHLHKEENPPDFRWDKMEHLDLDKKLTGAAA